jgi:hypothetical protein
MSHRKAKIKRLNAQDKPESVRAKTKTVGANTSGSSDPAIAAKGALATSASGVIETTTTENTNNHNAALASTIKLKAKTKDGADAYNNLATIVELNDPNNPDNWILEGFEVTETEVGPLPLPGQPVHCSESNSDFLGDADLHHDPVPNADNYTHRVTKGDPTDDSTYIDLVNPEVMYSKSSCTVTLPKEYLNVPVFFKTTAHNNTGGGPPSAPYGGGRING